LKEDHRSQSQTRKKALFVRRSSRRFAAPRATRRRGGRPNAKESVSSINVTSFLASTVDCGRPPPDARRSQKRSSMDADRATGNKQRLAVIGKLWTVACLATIGAAQPERGGGGRRGQKRRSYTSRYKEGPLAHRSEGLLLRWDLLDMKQSNRRHLGGSDTHRATHRATHRTTKRDTERHIDRPYPVPHDEDKRTQHNAI
jgi:hypothetical protein